MEFVCLPLDSANAVWSEVITLVYQSAWCIRGVELLYHTPVYTHIHLHRKNKHTIPSMPKWPHLVYSTGNKAINVFPFFTKDLWKGCAECRGSLYCRKANLSCMEGIISSCQKVNSRSKLYKTKYNIFIFTQHIFWVSHRNLTPHPPHRFWCTLLYLCSQCQRIQICPWPG